MLTAIDHGNKHQNRSHLNNITSQNNNQSNCENILLCHKCIINCRRQTAGHQSTALNVHAR